jgi:osmoprotectant transport system ATP-binding protein
MDEPFGAVDPITRSTLQDELLRLQGELRKTIVFVTHDFGEAVKLGDRITVLGQQSKVLQYDTPQNILASPADETVAGFVGSGASLRQLGLMRIKDVELRSHPAVRRTDSVDEVRKVVADSEFDWAVVLDERERPVSWVRESKLRNASALADAVESLDVVSTQSTLEDALEAILAEQHASAVVTGPGSRYAGVVTLDTLIDTITRLRADAEAATDGQP